MALIIYPIADADSFITEADADTVIAENSVQSATWTALTSTMKEVYLRIATSRILGSVSTDASNEDGYLDESIYVAADSCLPKATALMAIHDLAYGLSSDINPNTGLISKQKVGDLEETYFHGNPLSQVNSRNTNPFPSSVIKCLNAYGANVTSGKTGIYQTTLVTK